MRLSAESEGFLSFAFEDVFKFSIWPLKILTYLN